MVYRRGNIMIIDETQMNVQDIYYDGKSGYGIYYYDGYFYIVDDKNNVLREVETEDSAYEVLASILEELYSDMEENTTKYIPPVKETNFKNLKNKYNKYKGNIFVLKSRLNDQYYSKIANKFVFYGNDDMYVSFDEETAKDVINNAKNLKDLVYIEKVKI